MKISVIIASYKRVRSLKKCLESLEKQIRKPDEVVVALQSVDKESIKFVKDNKNSHSFKAKMVITSKKGKIFQENAALRIIQSDIVCFIDDDVTTQSEWLKRIEKWYLKDERIGGVGGRDIVHQPDGTTDEKEVSNVGKIMYYGRSIGNHHNIVKEPRIVHYLKGCNMSYRVNLLDFIDSNLQGSDVIFEEQWIGLHIIEQGYKIIYDPQVLVDHFPSKYKGATKRYYTQQRALLRAHNQTYTFLSFLSFPRKIIFLVYSFLFGDSQNPGPGRLLVSLFKKDFNKVKDYTASSLRGKIKGLVTYHNRK